MELVNKNGVVLATEDKVRKGFCIDGDCFLRINLPMASQIGSKKVKYHLLDQEFRPIVSGCVLLNPDQEVFVFMIETDSGKKTKADISYRRISFEIDDETSTYFIVGSKGFIGAPVEFEKKLRKEKILV